MATLNRAAATESQGSGSSSAKRATLSRQLSTNSEASYGSNYSYDSGSDEGDDEDDGEKGELSGGGTASSSSSGTNRGVSSLEGNQMCFKKVTDAQIMSNVEKDAREVASTCNVGEAYAMTLLHNSAFNVNVVLSKFFENDCADAPSSKFQEAELKHGKNGPHECFICMDDEVDDEDFLSLGCGHYYCRNCWVHFMTTKIVGDSEVFKLTCMDPNCDVHIPPSCLSEITNTCPEVYDKYRSFLSIKVVQENPKYALCPSPSCECVFEITSRGRGAVNCPDCSSSFCIQCFQEDHDPCSCDDLRRWNKLAEDNSLTSLWLQTNTKDCPKCHFSIQKNGGCNHMTCSRCRHEFCWLCLGPWKNHANCSQYEENAAVSESRQKLARYTHSWERYIDYHRSARNVETLRKKAAVLAEKVDDGVSVTKLGETASEYLMKSVDVLVKCHKMLAFTYVHAYFMTDDAQKSLFEYQQVQLVSAVENLNFHMEKKGEEGTEIVNLCQVVVAKANHVREAAERGVFNTVSS